MLLVYGPRSDAYDFGPGHPLTPRRFGPGIDLLRSVGAAPGLAPEPAPDAELLWCHTRAYLDAVRRLSMDPFGAAEAGIGESGDDPPFAGMHAAAAAVAGGSIRALEAILRGDVEHAFHPGGGLHHAMPQRAAGFCIYNDPALAIARARRDGLRVLYVDLDVHHGDGVQAIHASDPGVMTVSIHETGRSLFPGTGGVGESGDGIAAGTVVNVPLEPWTGEGAWLAAVEQLLPELAAAFGPDLVVSQHGADSHAWDPLAHLRVTTSAMGSAARLVDRLAHRHAAGRWLATGGGGYDVYRVVPRTWSLVWLAGAHRAVPGATATAWRDRWAGDAARFGQSPMPITFDDPPNAGLPIENAQAIAESGSARTVGLARRLVVPRLLREARDRGWWDPADPSPGGTPPVAGPDPGATPTVGEVDAAAWERLTLAPRVIAPLDVRVGHAIVLAAIRDGAVVWAATADGVAVGVAIAGPLDRGWRDLLALGVAPGFRRGGLGSTLLGDLAAGSSGSAELAAEVTVAERDPVEPSPRSERSTAARRLLERAGFDVGQPTPDLRQADPGAIAATRTRGGSGQPDSGDWRAGPVSR